MGKNNFGRKAWREDLGADGMIILEWKLGK
jgi:hypothetical protein